MRGTALLKAFLPLAVYAVFTELALHGLSGLLSAASRFWSGISALEPGAVLPWANAAAGLAAVGLFWRQYSREETKDGGAKLCRNGRQKPSVRFLLLTALGVCFCLGGSGLIYLLSEMTAESSPVGTGIALEAVSTDIQPLQLSAVRMVSFLTFLLCSGCIIPFTEEFLFRRVMYASLRKEESLGVLGALILSSLLFGLYHGQLLQGIYAGLLGALLAVLYQNTENLAVPVTVHAAANLSAVLLETVQYGKWLENNRPVLLFQTGAAVLLTALIFLRLCKKREDQHE